MFEIETIMLLLDASEQKGFMLNKQLFKSFGIYKKGLESVFK